MSVRVVRTQTRNSNPNPFWKEAKNLRLCTELVECRMVQLPWKSLLSVLREQQKVLLWILHMRVRERDVRKSNSIQIRVSHETKSCLLPKNPETLIWLCFHSQALKPLDLSIGPNLTNKTSPSWSDRWPGKCVVIVLSQLWRFEVLFRQPAMHRAPFVPAWRGPRSPQ